MYRLSLIISEIYNKYLPLAERDGIVLNLDFSDTTREISDPERVKAYLDEHLDSTLKRSTQGEVTISVDKSAISITDSATTLSPAACALLSNRYIDVTSRVGFGTTVQIFFTPRPITPKADLPERPHLEAVDLFTGIDDETQQPVLAGEVELSTQAGKQRTRLGARLRLADRSKPKQTKKSRSKSTSTNPRRTSRLAERRTQRQLAAAAKKADREVKRITKKFEKQTRKLIRDNQKRNAHSVQTATAASKATKSSATATKASTAKAASKAATSRTKSTKTVRKLRLS